VRRRVLARPNVTLLERHDVEALVGGDGRVTGVRLRPLDGEERTLEASLVLDATGRGSRAARWLSELGFEPPAEALVGADIGYTTRHYRREPGDAGGADAVLINPTPPHERRFGVLLAQEHYRWVLTPPTSCAGARRSTARTSTACAPASAGCTRSSDATRSGSW